jgi:hypothetical protein
MIQKIVNENQNIIIKEYNSIEPKVNGFFA